MSEPPENEPDAASSPGTEPEPAAPAKAALEEDAKPATASAAPSDDAEPATENAASGDDAKAAAPVASEDAKPPVSEAIAPPRKKAAKKKKKKKTAKASPPNDAARADKPDKQAKEEKHEPKPIPGVGTPDGDKLARAVQAFDAGNYALVRTLTTELEGAADADVKEYAKGLRRRIDIDPIQIVVLVACLALFLVIAYVYVLE